jgi:cytochrome P450
MPDEMLGNVVKDVARPQIPLAKYLPPDTVVITDFNEAIEVLRHPSMRTESGIWISDPFLAGSLNTLHGREHIFRRRIMNRLVRSENLNHLRDEVTLPALLAELRRIGSSPESDGVYRADLVTLTRNTFMRFAAELVGIDASTEEAVADLVDIIERMGRGLEAKYMTGDSHLYVDRGLEGQRTFRDRYFDPAISRCLADQESDLGGATMTLMSLLATHDDPAWANAETAVVEAMVMINGSVGTSEELMTNAVDQFDRWLVLHPEDGALRQDLDFLGRVIQETLRLLQPAEPHIVRQAVEAVVLPTTGRMIKKGQWVAVIHRLADADPEVFGHDAAIFNPRRELPAGLARYGLGFAAGPHQCIGLRVVLGDAGIGTHAHVLRTYLAAGVKPDPSRPPLRRDMSLRQNAFRSYPVIFTNLEAVTG